MAPVATTSSSPRPPRRFTSRTPGIHPAAARMWEPEREWVPATPSSAELVGGIAGGLFGAISAPLIARPVLGAMASLGPGPGSRPVDAAEMGDPGWFGPDSVAWRVHSDPSLLVAGVAAFTLQALHPLAMAGVAEHSAFSDDFMGRTRRTGEFVQGVVYGSTARAERLCRMVRKVHEPVVGTAPDGRPYAANDPELLDWVHIAEYLAIAAANRRFALHPMSRDELDQYIAEVAIVGEHTGVEAPPRSWAELLASLERHRPNLAVAEYAAAGLAFLDDPPIIPAPAKPVWRSLWAGAKACLPPVGRRLLDLKPPHTAELATCRATLRLFDNLGGDGPDLAAAKIRMGITA
ncbi:MAG TPA: oxygenase MpaB family protein [Acidimicrobiales bacterium]|nr:oxygenase MpaB family protein [Acidimicrobiales bacterium]